MAAPPLLQVHGLTRRYGVRTGLFGPRHEVVAVEDVDFAIERGEIVGIIGASGSGKSTIGRLLTGLDQPDGGQILFDGARIDGLSDQARRPLRRRLQLVLQDASSALNPRRRVGVQIATPILRLGVAADREDARERTAELLRLVGLDADAAERYPHEFSGGQRQRINIARSLGVEAECLILDEPTSALDVSVQAQILALLLELRQQLGLTYVFISHNLAVVQSFCDRILVLDKGRLVENLPSGTITRQASAPATRRLLEANLFLSRAPAAEP
ncbi:dipeptide/oligopeptide/nickel ABC transporter ATP-binding protein [Labrys neptuniae]|uniref:dipeptide/oligopeptide/nickel ABC transporter ATP-binding protein n=1 Tax=Labrys neptuniae TaxID=376174 RepID=UPI00288FC9CC|nr:dipeptide/oligopeptide/nickel ABC transporter ATP-binding protein [Labrys neptuniae]MDT3381340.1 dipeptide/oligopeptide/nickel ABC transporter ATP-binding protein [Labrys neptuniae]